MSQIDISEIDWNKLELEDFQALSEKLSADVNENKERKKRALNDEKKMLNLRGKHYMLPVSLINRLKLMKASKPREKLIEEILINYKPLQIEEV